VTHTQLKLSDIKVIAGAADFSLMNDQKVRALFRDDVLDLLSKLSKTLFLDPLTKQFPDIVTFSFFCRKANIKRLKRRYADVLDNSVGKGISFHIAPSNVPINFAYSLVMGLIAGNSCIVRVSSKESPQTGIICSALKKVLEKVEFSAFKDSISILTYDHSDTINEYFSAMSDVRVIWGGDHTVNKIRSARLPPRATEITFADRISGVIIDAENYLRIKDKPGVARRFYNDTYLSDQNACSSPRFIYWYGEEPEIIKAKNLFWMAVEAELVKKEYLLEPITVSDKLMSSYRAAIELPGTGLVESKDNFITRVELNFMPDNLDSLKQSGGFFYELSRDNFDDLFKAMTEKFQTLSHIGFKGDDLKNKIIQAGVRGVDRVVECGDAMEFDPIWDGVDVVRQMSRIISVKSNV
jgi:hypothetical protein